MRTSLARDILCIDLMLRILPQVVSIPESTLQSGCWNVHLLCMHVT